ncbi:MotA/TolQ/ExbB proton channel family protein [Porphyromonas cangingivalis]|uniref:Biopolymer transport protein ExbB n=1 Tax=Porphyromonas cangingivalis TaxID=36874 RepID=A0A099WXR4_PORCN|nr:biopolymer transporter ExbB [Porphyromonas cangingivalis]KGN82413.1 biopolymer transporter ExbB [Porphyromonas cangingivalis]SJZ40423.1 biopolymer transport protein ExbB [Porphyromonas cangingivalis]VEJ02776.1 colicin uptake protein TolQ [Porphyromonas cangingivalis]
MSVLLQIATDTVASAMPNLSTPEVMASEPLTLLSLATKGGWVMLILLLLSIIACYIFVERLLLIKKSAKIDPHFTNRIRDYIQEGKISSALTLCETQSTPGARMIHKGIQRLGRPMQDISAAIENVGNIEIAKLERHLPFLATIAAGSPMIGFLGTVTGMIRAFYDMANAGTNVDVTLLSAGIYEALVTTVGGLIVGIIALFAYNYLVGLVDHVVTKSESQALEFMDMINEPVKRS